jgi:hypothetical protein
MTDPILGDDRTELEGWGDPRRRQRHSVERHRVVQLTHLEPEHSLDHLSNPSALVDAR